jgi:hypothetical protein
MLLRFLSRSTNYIALSIVTAFTLVLLTVGIASANSTPRWPESPKKGSCANPTSQVQCSYPTNRKDKVYALSNLQPKPNANPVRIGGFYVNLETPKSKALVKWTGILCNQPTSITITGSRDITYSSTGKNYIDFASDQSSVCSFSFTLSKISPTSIKFVTNFDVDY